MSPTGRCSETARTGCSVANATIRRLRGSTDSGPLSNTWESPAPPAAAPVPVIGAAQDGCRQERLLLLGVAIHRRIVRMRGGGLLFGGQVVSPRAGVGSQPVAEPQGP